MQISDAVYEDYWNSPGPIALSKKHSWGAMEQQAIREFSEELEAALELDRRPDGPRAKRLKIKLATLLQCDFARVQREDSIIDRQGFGTVVLTQNSYRDGIFCAMSLLALGRVPC
jgi:hypothetical protein